MENQTYKFGNAPQGAQQQTSSGRAPLKSFKSGAIQVAIWENESSKDGQTFKFQTVTFERRYKDRDGNWKSTNNLRVNDIPKATLILQKAYEYLVLTGADEEQF